MVYSAPMRAFRSPVSWLLVIAMLFAQLATAAYACEREFVRVIGENATLPGPQDCDAMQMPAPDSLDQATPLCVDHCTNAAQAKTDSHSPVLDWSQASLILVAILPAQSRETEPPRGSWPVPGLVRAVAPPLPILLGRFRS